MEREKRREKRRGGEDRAGAGSGLREEDKEKGKRDGASSAREGQEMVEEAEREGQEGRGGEKQGRGQGTSAGPGHHRRRKGQAGSREK